MTSGQMNRPASKKLSAVCRAASYRSTRPGIEDSCSDGDFVVHQHRLWEEGYVEVQFFKDILTLTENVDVISVR